MQARLKVWLFLYICKCHLNIVFGVIIFLLYKVIVYNIYLIKFDEEQTVCNVNNK